MQTQIRQFDSAYLTEHPLRLRRGTLLVEMVVCTILLSVVVAILVPGIHAVHMQRKATRFETLALIELNNIAAQLPWIAIETEPQLSPSFEKRYPAANLKINVSDVDEASLQPVNITISQPNGAARPDLSRTLTVWLASSDTSAGERSDEYKSADEGSSEKEPAE